MSHKCKRKRNDKKNKGFISEDDRNTIALLNIQVKAVIIYLISDVFFYNFAVSLLQSAYYGNSQGSDNESNNKCNNDENDNGLDDDDSNKFNNSNDNGDDNNEDANECNNNADNGLNNGDNYTFNANISLVKATSLALAASIIISNVTFIAYERLNDKYVKGMLDYSNEPEKEISIASIYTILMFWVDLIGAIGLYKRVTICNIQTSPHWVRLLVIQLQAYRIRFVADYMLLNASLESIELIKSKYSEIDLNIENPDAVVVIASILYVIQRVMLFYVNYQVYLYIRNTCREIINPFCLEFYLVPNKLPVLGSIFGLTANVISLIAFIQIYKRNVFRPVFGR